MSATPALPNGTATKDPHAGPTPAPVSTALVKSVVTFKSVDELLRLCDVLYRSGIQPTGVDRPEKLVPMVLTGLEVGLGIMQSVKSISVVNGVCSIYGDAGLALVRSSGKLAFLKEGHEGEGDDRRAVCEIQRIGEQRKTFTYTLALAKKLKSYQDQDKKKVGPWHNDPDNMLRWRALWRALRSEFTDVLCGLTGTEENEEHVVTAEIVTKPATGEAAASAPTSAPAIQVEGEAIASDDQLREIVFLRTSYLTAKSITDPADQKKAWAAVLAPYGVASATLLTVKQADVLIDALGREHGFPPFSPRAKAA